MGKAIGLVDCNSFFCSCEQLFEPSLRDKPVIVLSNNDGCAIARTPEAKALGIEMAAPYFEIEELCYKNNVTTFSSNFSLYTDLSRRVLNVLETLARRVEVYSVDEAWLELEYTSQEELEELGKKIKEEVERKTGIPVSVGVAPTKSLAKIANHLAKKKRDGKSVFLMQEREQTQALSDLGCEEIWGIARASSFKLKMMGIHTAKQFRDYSNEALIKKRLTKVGLQIKQELQGIICFELDLESKKKKSIRVSRTFSKTCDSLISLQESIAHYASSASTKLRRQDTLCYQLGVFIQTDRYAHVEQYSKSLWVKMATPTNDPFQLIEIAQGITQQLYRPQYQYKKAGVMLSHFVDKSEYQLDLFNPVEIEEKKDLLKAMDRINHLYGDGTVRSAACGVHGMAWKMRRDHKSPRYTNSWQELQKIK